VKILLLDNYDSFTYNLFHYLEAIGCEVEVRKNTEKEEILNAQFDALVLSPGPGLPKEAGCLMEVIATFFDKKPILGVCLGMQALALHTDDFLYNLKQVKHGIAEKVSPIVPSSLTAGLPKSFSVGLYHSWAVQLKQDSVWKPILISESDVLMAIEHSNKPIYGVQFHPESILTEYGKDLLENFVNRIKK
jgi:anthranilate synthase component 2